MTPLDRLAQIVNHINGPVGDENRVSILIECADALIAVARAAKEETCLRFETCLRCDTDGNDVLTCTCTETYERLKQSEKAMWTKLIALDNAIIKAMETK